MFRDRTNLFLSYRRTFPHSAKYSTYSKGANFDSYSDEDDLSRADETVPMIDLEANQVGSGADSLPPSFIDLTYDIDEYLMKIEHLMKQLAKLYKKNSLPGFEDKSHDEKEIEEVSFDVTQLFQRCYNVIKKLHYIYTEQNFSSKHLLHDELIILDNLQKKYAQRIQVESNKFRVLQNNYLKFLNKDDMKPILPKLTENASSNLLLLDENEQNNNTTDIEAYSRRTLQRQQQNDTSQRFLHERDEEIKQLAKGVLEVSTIFREMQTLIIDQGTIVDRIDYNLENTVIELKEADKELDKATHYQKRTQKCKVILLLSLCVLALFFFVMLKPHGGTTKYKTVTVEAPPVTVDKPDSTIPPKTPDVDILEPVEDITNEEPGKISVDVEKIDAGGSPAIPKGPLDDLIINII